MHEEVSTAEACATPEGAAEHEEAGQLERDVRGWRETKGKPIRVEDMKQEGVDCFRTGRFGSALGAVPRSVCKRASTRDAEADRKQTKVARGA